MGTLHSVARDLEGIEFVAGMREASAGRRPLNPQDNSPARVASVVREVYAERPLPELGQLLKEPDLFQAIQMVLDDLRPWRRRRIS